MCMYACIHFIVVAWAWVLRVPMLQLLYKADCLDATMSVTTIINHNSGYIAGIGVAHDIKSQEKQPYFFPDDDKVVLVKPEQAFRSTRNTF